MSAEKVGYRPINEASLENDTARDKVQPLVSTHWDGLDEDLSKLPKERLARQCDRELRRISTLRFWGSGGMLLWFLKNTYQTFVCYSCLTGSVLYLQYQGMSVQQLLSLEPGYRPFLMCALQFLAAFLVGVGLNDAVARYKGAMGAMTDLMESVESLRMVLLSSTFDPKFRVCVQVYITWFIVLLRKKITFFTEDFAEPIDSLITPAFRESVLFQPEVLWAFDRTQAEFLFNSFLVNTKLLDKEGLVKKCLEDMVRSCRALASLLMVRSPTTRHWLGRTCVELFMCMMPVFNEDVVTLVALPFIAMVLVAIIHLSSEISEPWGRDYHDLPADTVFFFLSTPSWYGEDKAQSAEAIAWMNRGLTEHVWTFSGTHPIPRQKRRGAHKGESIDFEDFRSLPQIAGHDTFADFIKRKTDDMDAAEKRGRRMPGYLRWK